jgi:hypothetical protein
MAKRTLCQAPRCIETARQAISAAGTDHQLRVCNDSVHERWAKGQINQDFPARAAEVEYLDDELNLWRDDPNAVVITEFDDDTDGM